jgi:hypothetical protein
MPNITEHPRTTEPISPELAREYLQRILNGYIGVLPQSDFLIKMKDERYFPDEMLLSFKQLLKIAYNI